MKSEHLQFRPGRIAVAAAIGLAIVLAVITLAVPLWHEYQVRAQGGVWYMWADAEGKVQTLYGSECQPPK